MGYVLVIGDVMLDRRTEGEMSHISREAPAPIIRQQQQTDSLGGAGNVARNIQTLGHQAVLLASIGDDAAGRRVQELCEEYGVHPLLAVTDTPTTVKHRITSGGTILCRVDEEEAHPDIMGDHVVSKLQVLAENQTPIDLIVIADYDKGLLSLAAVQSIRHFAVGIPIFADVRPNKVDLYEGVGLLKPNFTEAIEMVEHMCHPGLSDTLSVTERAHTACAQVSDIYNVPRVVVTAGRHGCVYKTEHMSDPELAPPFGVDTEVRDVCGAGDTTMAALAAAYMEKQPFSQGVAFAMQAAGLVVRQYGVVAPTREELGEFVRTHGGPSHKIHTIESLVAALTRFRRFHPRKRVALLNGCFDGLHSGHIDLFEFAATRANFVIVAYNDDASLKALKGEHRPRVPAPVRARHLSLLPMVDAVVPFSGDVELLARTLNPDVLVKGADSQEPIPGADYVRKQGGELALCPVDSFYITIQDSSGGD